MNGLTLPDQTPELHYGEGDLVTVSFPLTEQTVSGFSMSPQSSLALSEASPQLVFNLVGASLEFDFAYQLATDPVWLHDSGTGRVLISGMNASFLLTPAVVDGALELAFAPTGPVAMDDYQFALTGHTDVTKTFARLMTQF